MIYDIPVNETSVPTLEDYLRAIRERWRLIAIATALGLALSIVYLNSRVATYDAEAKVVVNPTITNALNNSLVRPVLEREKEVIASVAVANEARTVLLNPPPALQMLEDLNVSFVNDSDTLKLTYTATDPDVAADRVNAIAAAYVNLRETSSINVYELRTSVLNTQVEELQAQLDEVGVELGRAQARRNAAYALPTDNLDRPARIDEASEEVSALQTRRTAVNNDLNSVRRELRTARTDAAGRNVTGEVSQLASPPTVEAGPPRSVFYIGSLMIGALLGIVAAFVLDRLDRTAKGATDVEAALSASVLGSVPNYGVYSRRGGIMMLNPATKPRAQRVREAYRRLRASISFLQASREMKALLFTSARPGEGKSATVANVAVAAAHAGSRVVVVSADMRRPVLERLFGIQADRGLSTYLADPSATDILVGAPDISGLSVLPSGPVPPNPSELLSSPTFSNLIEQLKESFDLILIDMPPVLSAADATSAAPAVDGVVVVVDSERTDTDELLRVRTSLEQVGAVVAGAVMNKDRTDSGLSLRRDRYSYEKVSSSQ